MFLDTLRTKLLVSSLFAVAGGYSADAQASDTKIMSGTMCTADTFFSGGANSGRRQPGIRNEKSGDRTFFCPVIRDDDESDLVSLSVVVYDGNGGTGEDVACTLFTTNYLGSPYDSKSITPSTGTGKKTYTWSGGTMPDGQPSGSYILSCTLPEPTSTPVYSYIDVYSYTEQDDND